MADAKLTPQQQIAILAEALAASRSALGEVRRVLHAENEKPGGAIRDTIWRSGAETLFDYIDAALDGATPSPPVAAPPATPSLHSATEDFLASYRAKYRNNGKGGMRANAPMLKEVTALNAAFRAAAQPQPQPAQPLTGAPDIETRICAEIMKRQAVGIKKYGQRLCDNPADIRDRLQHLLEEQLDAAIYTRWAMDHLDSITAPSTPTPPEVAP